MLLRLVLPRPPLSPSFPYTTLFRSNPQGRAPARSPLRLRQYFADALDDIVPGPLGGRRQPSEIRDLLSGNIVDRKSTRLNSSHVAISYAVFCLNNKKQATCDN